MMNSPSFSPSRITSLLLSALVILVLLISAFWMGTVVGERRVRHYRGWSSSHHRPFMPMMREPRPFPPMRLPLRPPSGNGVFGHVASLSETSLVITDRGGLEQTVLVTSSTAIRINERNANLTDIHQNDEVSVFGMPTSQGQIDARLIRLRRQ